jgi:hypothetical protein
VSSRSADSASELPGAGPKSMAGTVKRLHNLGLQRLPETICALIDHLKSAVVRA